MHGKKQDDVILKSIGLLILFLLAFYEMLWLQPGEGASSGERAETTRMEELENERTA